MNKRIKSNQFTKILGFKIIRGVWYFHIKWNDASNSRDTWEPVSNFKDLKDFSDKFKSFMEKHDKLLAEWRNRKLEKSKGKVSYLDKEPIMQSNEKEGKSPLSANTTPKKQKNKSTGVDKHNAEQKLSQISNMSGKQDFNRMLPKTNLKKELPGSVLDRFDSSISRNQDSESNVEQALLAPGSNSSSDRVGEHIDEQTEEANLMKNKNKS